MVGDINLKMIKILKVVSLSNNSKDLTDVVFFVDDVKSLAQNHQESSFAHSY